MINTFVALDLETTGLNAVNDKILEIGALKVVEGEIADKYNKLINPCCSISAKITELTGITQEMAMTGIDEEEAINEICDFCEGFILLGHNIGFDYSFLKAKSMKYGKNIPNQAIDTLKIARKKLKELESRSLSYLCEYFEIPPKVSHRAYDDALSAYNLYKIFQDKFADEEELFDSFELSYKVKKESPITAPQIRYLTDLLNYHGLSDEGIDKLSKSEASKHIDYIIRNYGRIGTGYQ